MSYCIAWKHGNNVFMLSDTAISSRVDEPMVPYNSMRNSGSDAIRDGGHWGQTP